jgi:hypothetical protein
MQKSAGDIEILKEKLMVIIDKQKKNVEYAAILQLADEGMRGGV